MQTPMEQKLALTTMGGLQKKKKVTDKLTIIAVVIYLNGLIIRKIIILKINQASCTRHV